MWPREEDDFMEIGNTKWVPSAEGWFFNTVTKHTMDDLGREYDENGILIFDPNNT